MARNRYFYLVLNFLVVLLGLASRRYSAILPSFVAEYAGDTLWATMVFISLALIAANSSTLRIAIIGLAVSYAVEVSQLYHASWIDNIRDTRFGGLVLGHGFLWTDIACYTAGIALGAAIDRALRKPPKTMVKKT